MILEYIGTIGLIFFSLCLLQRIIEIIRNPIFTKKNLKFDRPIVLDKKERNEILSNNFSSAKIEGEKFDVIIIGSGPSGLSTGSYLSKAGKKVLVLEQHSIAGGACHTFEDKGFEFDTGHHYSPYLNPANPLHVLVNIAVGGKMDFIRMLKDDVYCDEVTIGYAPGETKRSYYLTAGDVKTWIEDLTRQFPQEEETIKNLSKDVKMGWFKFAPFILIRMIPQWLARFILRTGLIDLITNYRKLNRRTTKEVFKDITKRSPDMSMVLQLLSFDVVPANQWPYPFWTFVAAIMSGGNLYPKGGSSEYSYRMCREIVERGGKVLVNALVDKIIVDPANNRACGVTVSKGSRNLDVYAPIIISSAGAKVTIDSLLPSSALNHKENFDWVQENRKHINNSAHTYFHVFMGLRGPAEELGLYAHSCRFFATNESLGEIFERYEKLTFEEAMEAEIPMITFLSCPSVVDPTYEVRHPGKGIVELLVCASSQWFTPWKGEKLMKRGDEYEARKAAFGHKVVQTLYKLFPQLEDRVEYLNFGTDLTCHDYFNRRGGGFTKLVHSPDRMSLEASLCLGPETPIKGFFLTGEDTFVLGVVTAILSGSLTASKILGRNLIFEGLFWSFYDTLRSKILRNSP